MIVDAKSLVYIDGTELDYTKEGLNEGFKFNNPNQVMNVAAAKASLFITSSERRSGVHRVFKPCQCRALFSL